MGIGENNQYKNGVAQLGIDFWVCGSSLFQFQNNKLVLVSLVKRQGPNRIKVE